MDKTSTGSATDSSTTDDYVFDTLEKPGIMDRIDDAAYDMMEKIRKAIKKRRAAKAKPGPDVDVEDSEYDLLIKNGMKPRDIENNMFMPEEITLDEPVNDKEWFKLMTRR